MKRLSNKYGKNSKNNKFNKILHFLDISLSEDNILLPMAVSLHSPLIYTALDYEIQQSNETYWNTTWRLFRNFPYSFLNSNWIGAADYSGHYYRDPCFIIGIVLFVAGFIINRYADLSLGKLRTNYSEGYFIPHGYLFDVISCPNYFGALLDWFGWALGSRVILVFIHSATFAPRARHNHQRYKN